MESENDISEIKPLGEESIRRIVAEQAISDLSSIVKELVDNAIDAESTTIKIRLFGHGLDIIEVSDDGCGVPKPSRPYLAKRYATSKILRFEDIYSGTGLSLGFRGEALFSMACLSSQLVVATRTDNDEMAEKMEFKEDGSLDETSVTSVHRKVGTTVAVVKPFAKVPARRANMARRIRAERSKLFRLLESCKLVDVLCMPNIRSQATLLTHALVDAIFQVGVAVNLIDIVGGREDVALATSSTSSKLEETVSAVMGHKFLSTLAPVNLDLGEIVHSGGDEENVCMWGITGLLSKNPQGSLHGRTINCYSINGRVVELPKVTGVIRKVWNGFGGKQKPSCILSFTLPNDKFDINLSPDKQQVLLSNEEEVLLLIQRTVTDLFSTQVCGVFQAQQVEVPINSTLDSALAEIDDPGDGDRQKHKRRFAFVHDLSKAKLQHDLADRECFQDSEDDGNLDTEKNDLANHKNSQEDQRLEVHTISKPTAVYQVDGPYDQCEKKRKRIFDFGALDPSVLPTGRLSDLERRKWNAIQSKFRKGASHNDIQSDLTKSDPDTPDDALPKPRVHPERTEAPTSDRNSPHLRDSDPIQNRKLELFGKCFQPPQGHLSRRKGTPTPKNQQHQTFEYFPICSATKQDDAQEQVNSSGKMQGKSDGVTTLTHVTNSSAPSTVELSKNRRFMGTGLGEEVISTPSNGDSHKSLDDPKQSLETTSVVWRSFQGSEEVSCSARQERLEMRQRKKNLVQWRNQAEGCDTTDPGAENLSASVGTKEFSKGKEVNLSKSEFQDDMFKVLGQFNLGFILCLSRGNDLWILDQHACDEKFNFEALCRDTILHQQKLVRPMPLDLSPSEEACILDHLDLFQANGFHFEFNAQAPIRKRLFLTALPHSGAQDGRKAVQFGKEDVRALCSMLSEGSGYDAGSGGTGTDGSGKCGNNAVRRYASTASSQSDSTSQLILRLPKAIAMFASRACRTSIMIGTALSHKEMERIVTRLADVEHPWNCPHGRPTIRHVGHLLSVMLNDERKAAAHISGPTTVATPMTQQEFTKR
eukprot:scaffold3079_cov119-Cylindrotheca_fusiformis.AAC.17